MQDFETAARRHYDDALLLHEHKRMANADQLVGFATECALKAILVGFLGAACTTGKPVSVINGKSVPHGHLPDLWSHVPLVLAGRTVGAFAALFAGENPFESWSVHNRYAAHIPVTTDTVGEHIAVTRRVLGHLETATVLGSLP